MGWPFGSTTTLHSLGILSPYFSGDVTNVKLLGYGDIPFSMTTEGLKVKFPKKKPSLIAGVMSIAFSKNITRENLTQLIGALDSIKGTWTARINDNTGCYNRSEVERFEAAIDSAAAVPANADIDMIRTAFESLQTSYRNFLANGRNKGGAPEAGISTNITSTVCVEANNFSRTDNSSTRFGTPKYWTVENFKIVESDGTGTKNGIDKYSGTPSLMLGVWDDAGNNKDGSLKNARIYRKVSLKRGRYYFGATYNALYRMPACYMFVSDTLLNTADIPDKALSFYNVMNASMDGKYYGMNFTLDKDATVYLGWAADLTGVSEQEFRAEKLEFFKYTTTGIEGTKLGQNIRKRTYYALDGKSVSANSRGLVIEKDEYAGGKTRVFKMVNGRNH
jgi:alpha-L-fucosidase